MIISFLSIIDDLIMLIVDHMSEVVPQYKESGASNNKAEVLQPPPAAIGAHKI